MGNLRLLAAVAVALATIVAVCLVVWGRDGPGPLAEIVVTSPQHPSEPPPSSELVEPPSASTAARVEAAPTEPQHARPKLPPARISAATKGERPRVTRSRHELHGLVRDADSDAPVAGARIRIESELAPLALAMSGADGIFRATFTGDPARYASIDPPPGWKPVEKRLELSPSHSDGTSDVVFALQREVLDIAGDISGFLTSESGPWREDDLPKPRAVLLNLVSTKDPHVSMDGEIATGRDAHGELALTFVFRNVARGEYELTLSSLDSFRWTPKSQVVAPPVANITFLRYDKDPALPLVFRVFDRASGAPIQRFETRRIQLMSSDQNGVFLHTGPMDYGKFPVESSFQWSLWADGYAPAFGDESSFVEKYGKRIADVYLSRGWGTRLLVLGRDPAARVLENAEVIVDGRAAGRTNRDGVLLLAADERPKRIEVRYRDWKLSADPLAPYNGRNAEQRAHVMLAFLDPPK